MLNGWAHGREVGAGGTAARRKARHPGRMRQPSNREPTEPMAVLGPVAEWRAWGGGWVAGGVAIW
jgi:hypothetical protein